MISLAQLELAAAAWVGTPYSDNGATRGIAASCHGLCWALYREAGWDHGLPLGNGPSRWSGRSERSALCEFMDARAEFARLASLDEKQPGDLLGFTVGGHIAHAGLLLCEGRFAHALRHYGVRIHPLRDPTWAVHLACAWRPATPILP